MCVEDRSLTKLQSAVKCPTEPAFMNRERLVGHVVVGGHLGHSHDKRIELSFLIGVGKGSAKPLS